MDDGQWVQDNVKEGVPYDFEIEAGRGNTPPDRVEIDMIDALCY